MASTYSGQGAERLRRPPGSMQPPQMRAKAEEAKGFIAKWRRGGTKDIAWQRARNDVGNVGKDDRTMFDIVAMRVKVAGLGAKVVGNEREGRVKGGVASGSRLIN
ncbi:hypothetical protein THAOC_02540 [Thalassiosira oceanica]|uniref:Uncharacterized protein n=1 Tax=Thalassiosira oceanica TaxID=159749 RepID=K0TFC4_THAOC|nr:hypothetical protein THAOC_02540 [Thalassiosira oceanica]|eukprot:EJK75724.1 hypothetical protein THAOC_02540 [Thalassiosira oceanica]